MKQLRKLSQKALTKNLTASECLFVQGQIRVTYCSSQKGQIASGLNKTFSKRNTEKRMLQKFQRMLTTNYNYIRHCM